MAIPAENNQNIETTEQSDLPSDGVRFSFRVAGRPFQAWIQDDAGTPRLTVSCDVGNLPYSAESRTGRRTALMMLSAAGKLSNFRLMLTDLHKISLLTSETPKDAADPKSILSTAARAAAKLLPFLALMDSCLAGGLAGRESG